MKNYVKGIIKTTTFTKNEDKGFISDLLDQIITEYLKLKISNAAQRCQNSVTISIPDLTAYLAKDRRTKYRNHDYYETIHALGHALDQLNDEPDKYEFEICKLNALTYAIVWPDESEF